MLLLPNNTFPALHVEISHCSIQELSSTPVEKLISFLGAAEKEQYIKGKENIWESHTIVKTSKSRDWEVPTFVWELIEEIYGLVDEWT